MVRMQTKNRSYTKGHSENNLRQINTFFIDFDIHTEKETISASDILTTAIDLGFMPTLIIKSDKGYQAYFCFRNASLCDFKIRI